MGLRTPLKRTVMAGQKPLGPYSPAVDAGGFIYVSGTFAENQDDTGAVAGKDDIAAQTRRAIERATDVLTSAGTSLDRVVSVTVYLKSAADFQAMNDAYRGYWPADPPARTTVITDLVLPDALVELSMIAVPPGAERTVVHPQGWVRSPNPYSYAIRSGDTLFLSGLVPRNGRDNTTVTGGIAAQTRAVMENAAAILDAAGMSLAHVVNTRVYLTDVANFQSMNDSYRPYFASSPPTRATVQSGLAGSQYLVEMTMTASSAARQAVGEPPPSVPISTAIRAGNRLYVSGVLGNTPDTRGDVSAQTREVLARIAKALAAGGASPADVVDSLVYLRDVSHFATMNAQYRAFFGADFPARTTIGTPLVPDDGLIEIMVTAVTH
jgi:reactive intermediate/imine deaminase